MKCRDVQRRISECLDEGRAFDSGLRQHLDACPTCAAFERDACRLERLLTAGQPAAPAMPPRRRRRTLVYLGPAIAAAAAVLLVVTVIGPWTDTTGVTRPGRPLAVPVVDVQDLADRAAQTTETLALTPYRQELALLADDARSVAATLLSWLPAPAPSGRPPGVTPAREGT